MRIYHISQAVDLDIPVDEDVNGDRSKYRIEINNEETYYADTVDQAKNTVKVRMRQWMEDSDYLGWNFQPPSPIEFEIAYIYVYNEYGEPTDDHAIIRAL